MDDVTDVDEIDEAEPKYGPRPAGRTADTPELKAELARLEAEHGTQPTPKWEHLCVFEGGMIGWKGDAKSGDLHLTFAVPPKDKYSAMDLTDQQGRRIRVTVEILTFSEQVEAAAKNGWGNPDA